MQVNKFVHPAQTIPAAVRIEDLQRFTADYNLPENFRIRNYLEKIDNFVFEKIFTFNNSQEKNEKNVISRV